MSDLLTVGEDGRVAIAPPPDYMTTSEDEFIVEPYLLTGFRKAVEHYHETRSHNGGYSRDIRMTSFLNDMLMWVDRGVITNELKPLIDGSQSRLLDEEREALSHYFRENYDLWADLIDQVDSQVSDYTKEHTGRDQEMIVFWAQFNQKLANTFYQAGHLSPDNPARKNLEQFVDIVDILTRSTDLDGIATYDELVNGALAQSALMKTLEDLGCFIIVPNYENEQELGITDAKGVDFIAVSPQGKIYFIDSKGRRKITEPEVESRIFGQHDAKKLCLEYLRGVDTKILDAYPGIAIALSKQRVDSYEIGLPTRMGALELGGIKKAFRDIYYGKICAALEIPFPSQ